MNASISVPYDMKSSHIKQNIDVKGEEVRKKKKIITEEKMKYLKSRLHRREIRENEERKANEIHKIHMRKLKLEKKWLGMLYLIITADQCRESFLELKQKKIRTRILQMKAYIIQKRFNSMFKFTFPFHYRILALAKNSIMLLEHMSEKIQRSDNELKLVKAIKESSLYKLVPDRFDRLNILVIKIQTTWRSYAKLNNQRIVQLSCFWNKMVNASVAQLTSNKRSKKKVKTAEKLMKLPMETKDRVLREHLQYCKLELIQQFRDGKSVKVLNYIPDEETMKKILLSLVTENAGKKVKSSHQSQS